MLSSMLIIFSQRFTTKCISTPTPKKQMLLLLSIMSRWRNQCQRWERYFDLRARTHQILRDWHGTTRGPNLRRVHILWILNWLNHLKLYSKLSCILLPSVACDWFQLTRPTFKLDGVIILRKSCWIGFLFRFPPSNWLLLNFTTYFRFFGLLWLEFSSLCMLFAGSCVKTRT